MPVFHAESPEFRVFTFHPSRKIAEQENVTKAKQTNGVKKNKFCTDFGVYLGFIWGS